MSDDDFDFDEGGEMAVPTMRGNANLDPQDYARGPSGRGSSILDDEIEEDVLSTPGRNPGAASAPDIDGTDDWTIDETENGPGMEATTFGNHPWGPGSAVGYRPHSMQSTDMALRDTTLRGGAALSGTDADPTRNPKPMRRDDMHNEPEVLEAETSAEVEPASWHGNRNQRPSNFGIPKETLYDRDSYEYDDSSQDTIGSGVFDMEEGVTWRPRDGIFAHQYALPAYIGDEDELGIQQSEMFDTTAGEFRVVQPSAAGVPLSARVPHYKQGYSPFVKSAPAPASDLRPHPAGPSSHVEAFGRKVADMIVAEAKTKPKAQRGEFLAKTVNTLGSNMAQKTGAVVKSLVAQGQNPEAALKDAVAHAVMNAAVSDLQSAKRGRGRLTKLDRLASNVQLTKGNMQAAAVTHIAPLAKDVSALKTDLGRLYSSPAALGMGQVAEGSATATPPTAPSTIFTPTNILIGAAIGVGGYFAWQNRKSIARNARKLARKAGIR